MWGDIGAGFRAPTLNELYRQFRVGTVLTLANNQLGPERLVGGELGVSYMPRQNVMLRSTYFDNRVKDPVSNVTLTTVGANVTQQRQNLGKTRIHGLQTDAEVRIGTSWRFAGGYLYEQAKVREFAANPALVGKFLPQVPAHRGSVQVVYSNPRFLDAGVHGSGARHAVRRRPQRPDGAGHLRAGPAGIRASRRSPPHAPSAATSRRSSACRTSSTRNTSSARCRRPSARRGMVTGGVRVRFSGRARP